MVIAQCENEADKVDKAYKIYKIKRESRWYRFLFLFIDQVCQFFCPNKEAAMGIIVVSLPCTAYHWGAFIAFCSLG